MFRRLIGVNGIGPKGALGILSALSPDDLRLAILTGDAKAISKAPGVGAKTAQRIILDLKDKVSAEEMLASVADTEERTSVPLMQEAGREAYHGTGGSGVFKPGGIEGGEECADNRGYGCGGSAQGITEVSGIFIRLGEQEVQYEQENYNN